MSELLKCALCILMASPELLADSSSCISYSLPTPFSLFGPLSQFFSPFPLFVSQPIFRYLRQRENMHILVSIHPNGKPDVLSSMYHMAVFFSVTFLKKYISEKNAFDQKAPCLQGQAEENSGKRKIGFGPLVPSHPTLDGASGSPRPALVAGLQSLPVLCPTALPQLEGPLKSSQPRFYTLGN